MKRALTALTVAAVAALNAGAGTASAHLDALSATTTCSASGKVKLTPPLTFTPTVTKHVYTKANTSLTGCGGSVTSGQFAGTLTGNNDSCAGATASGTWTFFWNTGTKSKATVTGTTLSGGVVAYTGTVTSGRFKGSSVTGQLTFTVARGKCSGNGVSLMTFTGTLTI